MSEQARNKAVYDAFAAAWGAKDLERMNSLITDDAVYGASVGPEPGTTYRGRVEVMRGFANMLSLDAGISRIEDVAHIGDRAYAEWSYMSPAGVTSVRGIDIIEFRDGRITRKEAFRKAGGPSPGAVPPGSGALHAPRQPYAKRRFARLGLWTIGDFQLKAYGITAHVERESDIIPTDLVRAARDHTIRIEAEARTEGGHFNLGFVVVHEGLVGTWLLMDWWAHDDIRCQLLSLAQHSAAPRFESVSRPLAACVWEALPIAHESHAWVKHMLSDKPDREAYLSDWMPDGLH